MIWKIGVGLLVLDALAVAYCAYVGSYGQAATTAAATIFLGIALFMTRGV